MPKAKTSKKNTKNKIRTEWNLGLLYKSPDDSQIEKDIKATERAFSNFESKYKDKDFTKDNNVFLASLKDYERLSETYASLHAPSYFMYLQHLNSEDTRASAEMNKIIDRLTKASNKIIFYELKIGKIRIEKQKLLLSSSNFRHFHYFLKNIFERAKYNLSEAEEKIMALKSLPAREMWESGYEKLISKQTVLWKKKHMPLSEVMNLMHTLSTNERRELSDLILEQAKTTSDFAEAEINAVYTNKKIDDELRGFKNPYDSTLLSHETDEKMLLALVDTATHNFSISHRFYKLKAKLLKLKKMTYADRMAKIQEVQKKISFEKGVNIVKEAFNTMDEDLGGILDSYLKNGQIDVYPKKGKRSGAYCSGGVNAPTFLLLNDTGSMESVFTLAHEMGHGFHTEFSKTQKPLYQGYTIAVAEVASTFFEQVVFDKIFQDLNPTEQIIALHGHVERYVTTIFRQIACFNFERDLHTAIRAKGLVPKENIAKLMNDHMKAYLGPVFEMKELDGYFFTTWSHIRSFFYVYSYAYGALISKALYRKYKEDKTYLEQIKKFLSAGNSKSPQEIFMDIGIDTSDPNFWKEGLKEIEEDIIKLEKLAKKARMI